MDAALDTGVDAALDSGVDALDPVAALAPPIDAAAAAGGGAPVVREPPGLRDAPVGRDLRPGVRRGPLAGIVLGRSACGAGTTLNVRGLLLRARSDQLVDLERRDLRVPVLLGSVLFRGSVMVRP